MTKTITLTETDLRWFAAGRDIDELDIGDFVIRHEEVANAHVIEIVFANGDRRVLKSRY